MIEGFYPLFVNLHTHPHLLLLHLHILDQINQVIALQRVWAKRAKAGLMGTPGLLPAKY